MRKKFKKRKYYRLNHNILAPRLRVLDQEGKQIGILTKSEGLKLAGENEVDLVEVAPKASPPVCKLIDFKKFLYQQKKKERGKKEGRTELKEIRLRPFIGNHDYQTRLSQAKEFLQEGSAIRIRVRFFGREIAKKEFGFEIIKRFSKDLEESAATEREPQLKGRSLMATLVPKKQHGKNKKETRPPNGQAKSKKQENRAKEIPDHQDR